MTDETDELSPEELEAGRQHMARLLAQEAAFFYVPPQVKLDESPGKAVESQQEEDMENAELEKELAIAQSRVKKLRAALANIKLTLTELPNDDPPSDMADAIAIAHLALETDTKGVSA
jgi:primosomal protein N''